MSNDKKEQALCGLCGEPMPPGEEMFICHGFSGPCPKPPLPQDVGTRELALILDADEKGT
jgi:hypothetical protein